MMTELFWTIYLSLYLSLSLTLALSVSLLALLGSTQQEVKWAQFKGYSCVTRATECLSHIDNANAFSSVSMYAYYTFIEPLLCQCIVVLQENHLEYVNQI